VLRLIVVLCFTCCSKVNGRSALHFAAGWGEAAVTEQLLLKSCDVDALDKAGMSRQAFPKLCLRLQLHATHV
jgi:ankyrin repeat protein